jgi:pilus assembly protein CpaE
MNSSAKKGKNIGIMPVCVDVESMRQLREAAMRMDGVLLVGDFTEFSAAEREAPKRLADYGFRICLVDMDSDPDRAMQTAERLSLGAEGDTWVFGLSRDSNPQSIIRAMRSGCSEYLIKPLTPEKLAESLQRIAEKHKGGPGRDNGKLVTLMGAKGGTGVTALALHLALDIRLRGEQTTLLVDQHPALGDVSLYAGLKRHLYSFYDLVSNTERIDSELVKGFVVQHESGMDVLDSPENLGTENHAPPHFIDHTLDFLKQMYSCIVVDVPPGLTDETVATVRHSDHVLLVLTAEMPAVRNALRYLEHLSRLEFPEDRVHVVLNRYMKRPLISDEQIERALRKKIWMRIPNEYAEVSKAINAGAPSLANQSSGYVAAVRNLADSLSGPAKTAPEAKSSRGLLRALGF